MVDLAIVHERFTQYAGSERVVEQFSSIWPEAPVWAPLVDPQVVPEGMPVRAATLNRWYRGGSYAHLLPALPAAMRRLPLPQGVPVLASHHAFANQATWATSAPFISYVHSPARWMWQPGLRDGERGGALTSLGLASFSRWQRIRDYEAAARVTSFIANSHAVAARIHRWWDRDSTVIFPPVDTDFYQPDPRIPRGDFVLVAGRMVPYKRPEVAIAAAHRAGLPVVVAGSGRAMSACRRAAGPRTTFLPDVTDEQLRDLYQRCACLVLAGEEDFGIIPVEAQACGAPVVALGVGGALDTVIPGKTGLLVDPDTHDMIDGFAEALRALADYDMDPVVIRNHAETFSRDLFRERIQRHVLGVLTG